jgi:hypothetical protein
MLMSPLIIAALVLSAPVPVEDFGAARAKILAPFIDDQTVAVVRIDLTKADPDTLFKLMREVGGLDPKDEKELKPIMAGWLGAFKKAGGRELNYFFGLPDEGEPFVIVPLAADANVKTLGDLLNEHFAPSGGRERVGTVLVAGSKETLERVRKLKPAARPELAKAFAAAGDGAVQAVLLPPPQLVKLIDEKVPALPKELGGGSPRPFTRGVQWAAFGLNAPPKLGLRVKVQSPGDEAAKELDESAAALLKAVVANKEVRAALPGIDKVPPLMVPVREGSQLVLTLDDKQARAALGPMLRWAVTEVVRTQRSKNLQQVTLAAINCADANGGNLPAVAIFDKAAKPLLSWRVQLLPYLGEEKLYKEFHLDEPWDSNHNKKLIAKMPKVFGSSNPKLNEQGKTVYLAPTGKGTAWPGGAAALRYPASFPDGTSNTILFVLADDAHAVEWTKPEDLKIDPKKPHTGLGQRGGRFLVGLADGSVHVVKPTVSMDTLRSAFDPADGNPLGDDW